MISAARRIAFDVLLRVETQAAFASDLLYAASQGADPRDAGLAAEISMGTLRRQMTLDYLLSGASGRPVAALDAEVRIALRMGLYQLRHLDRVPAHAAVSESVDLVRRARKTSAAGLVNAVLRKAPRGEVTFPSDAIRLSMPEWLLDRWTARWGRDVALGIAQVALDPPATFVRLGGAEVPAGVELEPTEVAGAFRLVRGASKELARTTELGGLGGSGVSASAGGPAGPVRAVTLRIQDIGSQWVVTLLDLAPGQRFLDVCAAPGNKTAQAIEAGVRAIACDRHLHRLRSMPHADCPRLVVDATEALPFLAVFDRILVDAPCSGTGTLSRNPEIKWRLKPADLEDLHRRQKAILRHALGCLKPGGRLVYSTCSLESEENEDVVGLTVPHYQRIPGREAGDGFFAAVLT